MSDYSRFKLICGVIYHLFSVRRGPVKELVGKSERADTKNYNG